MGLKQLPLSNVEGQVDRLIPYYDYDAVLAHVLRNHTDVITARMTLEGAKLQPQAGSGHSRARHRGARRLVEREHSHPFNNFHALSIGIPFPIWDRNQGNIRAATSALVRAAEGPHQVEVNLTTNLAAAYATYKTNLAAMEYYRRNILPDQVRYYRGVFERRRSTRTWRSETWCRPSRSRLGRHRLPGSAGVALDLGRQRGRLSPDRGSFPTGQAPGTAPTA